MSFEANDQIRDQIDNLVTILGATSMVAETYERDPDQILFAVCVEAVTLYIQRWAERGTEGGPAQMIVDDDDLENPSRADDPNAKLETLSELMLTDALYDNVRFRLGLPEDRSGYGSQD